MNRCLLVLRHAKSDWGSPSLPDFDRPLAPRGKRDAPRMGRWLKEQGLIPDQIICSPAKRAVETAQAVLDELGQPLEILYQPRIYDASLDDLLAVLAEVTGNRPLVVGHNPGLDQLVSYLCRDELPVAASGKLMTTAAVAHVLMPDEWSSLQPDDGGLSVLMRPKEIE